MLKQMIIGGCLAAALLVGPTSAFAQEVAAAGHVTKTTITNPDGTKTVTEADGKTYTIDRDGRKRTWKTRVCSNSGLIVTCTYFDR